MTMKTVGIAELKARLSEYLRVVRRGQEITVLDRETPIARIVPYTDAGAPLSVRRPASGARALQAIKLPPPLKIRTDVVALLLEERQGER
jgi:prevent-host-death family protein